jgi:hypothetical protein
MVIVFVYCPNNLNCTDNKIGQEIYGRDIEREGREREGRERG